MCYGCTMTDGRKIQGEIGKKAYISEEGYRTEWLGEWVLLDQNQVNMADQCGADSLVFR